MQLEINVLRNRGDNDTEKTKKRRTITIYKCEATHCF